MGPQRDLVFLLPNKYDPTDDTPSAFRQAYNQLANQLAKDRDDLGKQCSAQEGKRAKNKASAAASEVKGTRFNSLIEDENGSTISPPTKHTFPASLTTAQLDNLTNNERKAVVQNIQRDIQALAKEKREKRDAAAAESKHRRLPEGAKKGKDQEEVKEDQDKASESELGQGWETVKRRVRR